MAMPNAAVADVVANLRRQIEERTGVPLKTATEVERKPEPEPAKVVSFPKPEPVTVKAEVERIESEPAKVPDYGADMAAELERLRAENEALKKRKGNGLSMRVSEKGALSIYGMGRFPTTLYKEQWLKVLDMADDIRAFIKANDAKLKGKD